MSEINILATGSQALYFLQRRWYIILFVLCVGIGIVSYKQVNISEPEKYYETKLLGETDSISNYLVVSLINTLKPSVDEKNIVYLTNELKITKKTASSIHGLQADIFLVNSENDYVNNNVVKVGIWVSDFSEMDNIRIAMEKYINEDPLFKGKGRVLFSPKYRISSTPMNTKGQINYVKYIVVFFALGLVLALAIDFFFSILKYRKNH